jgi:hypothetical protein
MSRVPVELPSSSTGTLNAAQIPSPAKFWTSSPHCGRWRMSRTIAGARWLKPAIHDPGQALLAVLDLLWTDATRLDYMSP